MDYQLAIAMELIELLKIDPGPSAPGERIQFSSRLEGRELRANFRVTTIHRAPERAPVARLWDGNVVELFLSVQQTSGGSRWPYYEFEISPYGERCLVKVNGDGSDNRDFTWQSSGFRSSVAALADQSGWEADLSIDLPELGWQGDPTSLTGNAFAIVGATRLERRFYALNLPTQSVPHFHLPEHFIKLA